MTFMGFLVSLAMGLAGLCMVMTTLLDKMFSDWDMIGELRKAVFDGLSPVKLGAGLLEDQADQAPAALGTRFVAGDARRDADPAPLPPEPAASLATAE